MQAVNVAICVVTLLAAVAPITAQQRDGSSAVAEATADRRARVPAAVRAANLPLAGVWTLVSEETRDANGEILLQGPNVRSGRFGFIAYDPAGYMGVTIAWPNQPALAGRQPTPEEALRALSTYNSYWGSFAVNTSEGVVTHQTFGALSPDFSATNQVRRFTISGNRLTLRPPAATNGDQRALTWERVPDLPALTATHRKLIGFWKLVSLESRNAKGAVVSANPGLTGFIVYTGSGHVMVHMMYPYRRRNVGPTPTPAETLATYRSYTSYFGRYTVHEAASVRAVPGSSKLGRTAPVPADNYVVHHIDGSFNSGAVGTTFQRFIDISGTTLTLRPPVTKDGKGERLQTTITWERLSD